MTSVVFHLALAVLVLSAAPPVDNSYREPNSLVPSLPQLTDEEEANLDRILDRFIRADVGQQHDAAEYKQALRELKKLGPESFFAVVRALNRAARIDDSCPAVVLAALLQRQIMGSRDPQLLDFARENIGLGIERSAHMRVLHDLQLLCAMRKRNLGSAAFRNPSSADLRETRRLHPMTVSELVQAIGTAKGHRRLLAMDELQRRDDDQAVATLAAIATDKEDPQRTHARALLVRHLLRQKTAQLKEWAKDPRAEVRIAVAKAASHHQPPLTSSLIDLLSDEDVVVRTAAHAGLRRLAHKDFGPDDNASETTRKRAIQRWRDWLGQQHASLTDQP